MLETRATVVQVGDGQAYVRASQGGCGQCQGKGCGTAKLAGLFCSSPRQFLADNPISAVVGDEVIVAVEEGTIMRGVALVYLVPLALLIAGALLGVSMAGQDGQQDIHAAAGALAGLVGGFLLVRRLSGPGASGRPRIARRYDGE